jgi:hypothetical protein
MAEFNTLNLGEDLDNLKSSMYFQRPLNEEEEKSTKYPPYEINIAQNDDGKLKLERTSGPKEACRVEIGKDYVDFNKHGKVTGFKINDRATSQLDKNYLQQQYNETLKEQGLGSIKSGRAVGALAAATGAVVVGDGSNCCRIS